MGPLLHAGLAILGALLALGLVASRSGAPRGGQGNERRRMALLTIAFAEGGGILGVVVGLLAITLGARLGAGSTRLLLTLTLAGVLIAAFIVVRQRGRLDRWIVTQAAAFGAGLAILGVVLAILSLVIHRFSTGSVPEWIFLVLGLIAGAGALGVGLLGSRAMSEIGGLDGAAAKAATSRAIRSILPIQLLGYGASFVAIVLIATR